MKNAGDGFQLELSGFTEEKVFMMSCMTILQVYYKFPGNSGIPFVVPIPENNGKDMRYYRSAFNADLMKISPTERAVDISEQDYWKLIENLDNLPLWKEKFPLNSWEIIGIGIVNFLDTTMDQSINMMTSNLLEGSIEAFDKVIENIKSLLRLDDLRISFFAKEDDLFVAVKKYHKEAILLNGLTDLVCDDGLCDFSKIQIMEKGEPFILSDVEAYTQKADNMMTRQLKKNKIKSYIITPLIYNGELLGCIEIGSPKKRELNTMIHERLNLVLPILSMAAGRFKQEELNHIEAIIQKECTTIHPSVKWRFVQSAKDYLEAEEKGERPSFEDLVFPDVYPLYGQMDIKGSSVKRNDAVREDLNIQLNEVKNVLLKAIEIEQLPSYKQMLYRLNQYLKLLEDGVFEGSEQQILSFLQKDVYPFFTHFKEIDLSLKNSIADYESHLSMGQNMIYNRRKAFDDSVTKINSTLADFIDDKQIEAQKMFPHYFERYKTDGIEYNIYIGQSIAEKRKFSKIYLDNIQLWQLQMMCEMEHEFHQLQAELPTFLEVASLILVFNSSLSIQFRMDEKHFDVDGAYNARYEIIKKRIDKANIKGTDERITVPGKIAIIYSSKDDAITYRKHISYLAANGFLKGDTLEDLEVDDLQGISGLKALRVEVDYKTMKESKNADQKMNHLINELNTEKET
ncbi:MAG: GAF domain-containing protein [Flavobacteriales bacterium]|nr:GAF domain-containing protein [Flavobacteriales bacterium]